MLRSLLDSLRDADASTGTRTSLAFGAIVAGTVIATRTFNRAQRRDLAAPVDLPPVLNGVVQTLDLMEGTARFYHRPGVGVPIVLLHSLNAAASSAEMLPIYEHLADSTTRPIIAMDWLGFGLSDRPAIRYQPALYLRQLRRLLTERIGGEADVVALSLGGEYAASVAAAFPFLVRRLLVIAPTSLAEEQGAPAWARGVISTADASGAFETFFYRLTRPASLRRFYARQVFLQAQAVPEQLVQHAYTTSHAVGAHHAPRFFVEGSLFLDAAARRAYASLKAPTLFVLPVDAEPTVQSFELLEEVLREAPETVTVERVDAGLMPHWEAPDRFLPLLDDFIAG